MLANLHTHTVFCDGENTPEEIVATAIEKGFTTIGFSGHAFTDFDEPFGIDDVESYITTVNLLKAKYKDKIQIYLGIEEDALAPITNRDAFDFIIGSHHYIKCNDKILPVDLSYSDFKKCVSHFGNIKEFATEYYEAFYNYLLKFKPTIIGHFDLITKYDEQDGNFLIDNRDYNEVAEKYLRKALKLNSFFEVNTGAMARGYRTSPYPAENLLYIIRKENGKIVLSSDCHSADALDFAFAETKKYLKDIGFKDTYILYNNKFIKQEII